MDAKQLTDQLMPVTIVNELRHLIETAWPAVPVHVIKFLYNPMP